MKNLLNVLLVVVLGAAVIVLSSVTEKRTTASDSASPAQTSPAEKTPLSIDERVAEIRTVLEELAFAEEVCGSVLIAHEGVPILQAAYGMADRGLEIPNRVDTKFNLGSLDKMFTGVAIMQLVEQDLVSLEGTIGEYLPDYPNPDVADAVTIHQLLTHTGGLGNYFDSPQYIGAHDEIRSLDDYFVLFADEPLGFEPGSQNGYSNSAYIVLGLIIEAVSGVSYFDYVREHIFAPSGMTDTACYELDAGTPNLAIGYTTRDRDDNELDEAIDNTFILPMRGGSAGGGYSTAPDLLAFANALMGNRLLSAESTEVVTAGKASIREDVAYAYGFFDRIVQGYRAIGHGGGFPGICSMLNIYPELGYTIVILSNSDWGCVGASEAITEALLD